MLQNLCHQPSKYNHLVKLQLRKIHTLKEKGVENISKFESSYFNKHQTLPERKNNDEYNYGTRKKLYIKTITTSYTRIIASTHDF